MDPDFDHMQIHISDLQAANSPQVAMSRYQKAMGDLGINQFAITGFPNSSIDPLETALIFNAWDPEWSKIYLEKRYYEIDPVFKKARTARVPFLWSSCNLEAEEITPRQRDFLEQASKHEMIDGVCVPIVLESGNHYVTSIRLPDDGATDALIAMIYMLTMFALQDLVIEYDNGRIASAVSARLSGRERECLQWSADGKTSWEIAQILGIAEDTVQSHIKSAGLKLDAVSRTQSVAKAFRVGAIH